MKLRQTKPNRTVGIIFVIAIVVVLISGLAPPAGAEDTQEIWCGRGKPAYGGPRLAPAPSTLRTTLAMMRVNFDR